MYGVTEQEFNRGVSTLKAMAAAGTATGEQLEALADMLWTGYAGNRQNALQAVRYWSMAMDRGQKIDTAKMMLVALCLKDGKNGLVRDEEKALRCIQAAADRGDSDAEYITGKWFLEKVDRFPQAERPAMNYLARAALHNKKQAQYLLGVTMLKLKERPEHRGHFGFEYLFWLVCAEVNGSRHAARELARLAGNDRDLLAAHQRMREEIRKRGCMPPSGTSEVFEVYGANGAKNVR